MLFASIFILSAAALLASAVTIKPEIVGLVDLLDGDTDLSPAEVTHVANCLNSYVSDIVADFDNFGPTHTTSTVTPSSTESCVDVAMRLAVTSGFSPIPTSILDLIDNMKMKVGSTAVEDDAATTQTPSADPWEGVFARDAAAQTTIQWSSGGIGAIAAAGAAGGAGVKIAGVVLAAGVAALALL